MLDELSVKNLGVISETRIEPGPGMIVVTGETGAGKTMLLGALRLLMGDSARSDDIGPDGDEALVEGRFLVDGEELVVARRVTSGRSRAYLDGNMVSARALADRLDAHIEIVGQHDQLSLTRPREARRLIDRQVSASARDAYQAAWARLTELRLAQRQLGGDRRSLERERDLVAYQVDEIASAGFESGDDKALERRQASLQHGERIAELAANAYAALDQSRDLVGEAVSAVRHIAELDPTQDTLTALVEGVAAELEEAVGATREASETVERDPEAFADVEQRLTLLGELRRKYGADLNEILAFGATASERHDELSALLERAATVDADLEAATTLVEAAGSKLRRERAKAAEKISAAARDHLLDLGFSDPIVAIDVAEGDPGPDGADTVSIRFASDARLTPGPVGRVASGGELSRLVLSLRLASGAGAANVVAFDEIDSGVGGATALAMGAKLATLADDRQVLCVTHLPQVAAWGDQHFVVERDGATATVRAVADDERLEELSRMLSGLPASERGREHAQELRALAIEARK